MVCILLALVPIIVFLVGVKILCVGRRTCDIHRSTESLVVPVVTLFRIEPIVGILESYTRQARATIEHILSNHCNAIRYRYARQTRATVERIVVDNCNAFRYRYARQARATVERMVVDNCKTVRERYTL